MRNMRNAGKQFSNQHGHSRGFTLVELVIAVLIILVLAGIALPNFMAALHSARLKGAVSDYSGLLQAGRIRAVDDDRFYSVYVLGNNPVQGFLDIYPQNPNRASGSGGNVINAQDPVIQITNEIRQRPAGAAPNT